MEDWLFWFVGAIALVVAEMFTPGFWLACLGIGAVAAGVAALVPGVGAALQGVTFAVTSLLSMAGLRPVLLRHFQLGAGAGVRTGVDALLGKSGIVTERIEPGSGLGRVKVDGEDWRGASTDATVIEAGTRITVIQVDGTTLMVEKES
jgi:membrane protein implicated in regulation of membrane protease activity